MPIPLSPSISNTAGAGDKGPKQSLTADDINDILAAPDDEAAPIREPKDKPKEDEKPKEEELELVEEELEDEKLDLKDDEKVEDLEIDAPPRKKEILAKYPNVFKDFPFLEKMLYRDRQYTELFGSFDDAKELAEKADVFNQFESQLLSGNISDVLNEVKAADERAFNIIVDDYLPTLHKVDKEAYLHVVGNVNKRLIMEMVQEANDTNNNDLKEAALLVNQFVFGSSKFTAPTNRVDRSQDPKKDEVEQERLSFVKERFETSRDDLQTQVDNTLRATINEYIDPRGNMSSYVKKNAVNDAMQYLRDLVASDPAVVKNLDRLWRAAFDSKFSREDLSKIKSYYLSKAKGSLKNAILKARAEALKDSRASRETQREEQEETAPQRGAKRRVEPGRPSQNRQGKNERQKGESVTEFFMRD